MLTYYISGSNGFTIRTEPTASNQFTMSLQDMTLQTDTTASLSGITYNGYESLLSFTASIPQSIVSSEYRVKIINSGSSEPIWHGTIAVFASQSIQKSEYLNQNDGYISNPSSNEYIIID
jgi:hypothetical protein